MRKLEIDQFYKTDLITIANMGSAGFPVTYRKDDIYYTGETCTDFDINIYQAIIRVRFYQKFDPNNLVWIIAGENTIGLQNIKTMPQLAYLYKLLKGTLI